MKTIQSVPALAETLAGRRFVSAEFMYKPRPQAEPARLVFDYALQSRLDALTEQDAILFICDSPETVTSLADFEPAYPRPTMLAIIANPSPLPQPSSNIPHKLDWDNPANWQQYTMTDRWARITTALQVSALLRGPGYLVMPAHDAVWGHGLLPTLTRFSQRHARGGLPAAVSPYTYHQHAPVPGVSIPQDIIDQMNSAFGRDALFGWKLRLGKAQGFWGKMGMIPFAMCAEILARVETFVWEDDLEIDRIIGELGYAARCLWVTSPALYHQSPPVFDEAGLRTLIERTLHYSLNIPGANPSLLTMPLGKLGQLRRLIRPSFARSSARVEVLINEVNTRIQMRLNQFGASWVDWGAYRYVMNVGNPAVEVWKRRNHLV